MKIGDYFERLKYVSVWDKNKCLDKGAGKKFEEILSSCRFPCRRTKKLESKGLRIFDYLANPVQVRPSGKNRDRSALPKIETKYTTDFFKKITITEIQRNQSSPAIRIHEKDVSKVSANISDRQQIDQIVNEAAARYGLPAGLIKGVIKAESNFGVRAVSSAGAQGLMQLMPGTAKELGVKDPFDIDQNIDGGTRYLKKMLDFFGGDVKLALAAYNAGPGTVSRYNGNVPYRETMLYVERVLKYSRQMA
ncbi:MAG: lytic transglycosylase domain-containing protein [Deltaproteobacteria bacterium]|nr:lytic transglycosylase domain-containing protein [Deltaproteobacteria bacterium]MBW1910620.1 lytic transglycosylase domain-containing protein [Deltaproteobacteria bacterium]MBW2034608.1 lytic transglycosylase domain-containing protein [Deltaproteobacteria bacterium]MBW2115405.1 lytic transglycosylase domain-containing protein [Deltaproteobacteria bacterium]MBW2358927.1 lytic transglycosylase domain-containing protein [Deltaproteobacteria bacterium]